MLTSVPGYSHNYLKLGLTHSRVTGRHLLSVWLCFKHPHGWWISHNISAYPVLECSLRKKAFIFLYFILCPLPVVLLLRCTEKSLTLRHPLINLRIGKIPKPSLHHAEQFQLSQSALTGKYSSPQSPVGTFQYAHDPLVLVE